MSDDLTPLPPQGMPRGNPDNAREIARGLKWLSDNFAETGMRSQANRALRESKWWVAYATTLESMAAAGGTARGISMSDDDLSPLPPQGMPRVTPAEARDTARAYKWLADRLTAHGDNSGEATRWE
jgi:hypothetical protein